MKQLLESGTCKAYPKILSQFKMVSWLQDRIATLFWSIHKAKVSHGSSKSILRRWRKEDQSVHSLTRNLRIGSLSSASKTEKHSLLKVFRMKLTLSWIPCWRSRSFGRKAEEQSRSLEVIWTSTKISKCLWPADCPTLASRQSSAPRQQSLTSRSRKEAWSSSYSEKLFLMSRNLSKTAWILCSTMSMLTRRLYRSWTKTFFKDWLNLKATCLTIPRSWKSSITPKLKPKRSLSSWKTPRSRQRKSMRKENSIGLWPLEVQLSTSLSSSSS